MRVLFVSRRYFPAISGMSAYAQCLLRELVALGHDVTMVSQFRGDEAGTRVYGGGPPPAVAGVRVIGLEARGEQDGGDFERDIEEMIAVAQAEHARAPFDVLHAQYGYPTGLAVLEASRRLGVPNVVSIQGGDGHWVGSCCSLHLAAMRAVCDHAGALLIGSPSFRDEVVDRLGTDPARFTIVPGAVDTSRFTPAESDPSPHASHAGKGSDPFSQSSGLRLLYHGRVDRRKGILDLLEAMRRVEDAELVVSGIGPDLGAARERAARDDLAGRVRFTGYVGYDEAPGAYGRGDVFVSPTYAEGFSNTILEAMASGLPVVSTRSVGVVDCVRDGENGLLVEPGDVDGLAAALRRILDDDGLRERLRAAALAEVGERYAWPVVARQIVTTYQRLRGTTPDTAWHVPDERPPCRFREAPHLL